MAFNLNTIKALFGKLAPMTDDVAGAVANYSDDAARLVANYGDDVVRTVDKVDDFLPPASVADSAAQASLKQRLIDKRLPYDHFSPTISPAPASAKASEMLDDFELYPHWGRFPSKTDILGPVTAEVSLDRELFPNGTAVMTPELPTSQLVLDDIIPGTYGGYDGFTLRPHKNTALSKWYDNALNNPKSRTVYNYAIGPSDMPHDIKTWRDAAHPSYDALSRKLAKTLKS